MIGFEIEVEEFQCMNENCPIISKEENSVPTICLAIYAGVASIFLILILWKYYKLQKSFKSKGINRSIIFVLNLVSIIIINSKLPSGNAFVSGAGGQKFKSRSAKIGHGGTNGSPSVQDVFERSYIAWVK